ncbi:hypothetical protein [Macrococcoides bohemicum]|uniref:hypothetical protein n=1 Tax=Macrococcoides bohemicum TaxID=1903056 RepID=UPI00289EC69E|nr:hypothetical protein [Macrococcus bohemicus]
MNKLHLLKIALLIVILAEEIKRATEIRNSKAESNKVKINRPSGYEFITYQ